MLCRRSTELIQALPSGHPQNRCQQPTWCRPRQSAPRARRCPSRCVWLCRCLTCETLPAKGLLPSCPASCSAAHPQVPGGGGAHRRSRPAQPCLRLPGNFTSPIAPIPPVVLRPRPAAATPLGRATSRPTQPSGAAGCPNLEPCLAAALCLQLAQAAISGLPPHSACHAHFNRCPLLLGTTAARMLWMWTPSWRSTRLAGPAARWSRLCLRMRPARHPALGSKRRLHAFCLPLPSFTLLRAPSCSFMLRPPSPPFPGVHK